MMNFGDVILRTLFPSFMAIQACRKMKECTLRAYWELLIVTQNRG